MNIMSLSVSKLNKSNSQNDYDSILYKIFFQIKFLSKNYGFSKKFFFSN